MPTTSNFGWTTPADTDLVKDGAAAIRTLGNGIDTSLVDLKGGTTGQILSKNSNTDLDYIWINNDQGDITAVTAGTGLTGGGTTGAVTLTNDMATTITAKGDLLVGTGNATYDNLAVGTNGHTLVADSSTATGVKWAAAAAGVNKNYLINGGFAIAQRGTSFVSGSNNDDSYTLDRWYILSDTNDVIDVTQDTTTVPTNGQFAIALDVETTNKKFGIATILEEKDCVGLIGNTVTFSFKAKVSSTTKLDNVKAAIVAWSGTGDTVTSDIISAWNVEGTNPTLIANATYENSPANLNVTTSYATYSISAAVDTASTKNIILFIWSDVTDTTAGDFLYIAEAKLELGSTATAFQYAGGTLQGELAACQRYYWRQMNNSNNQPYGAGPCISTTNTRIWVQFPTEMRIIPTSVDWSNLGLYDGGSAVVTVTSVGINAGGKTSSLMEVTTAGSLTQFRPVVFIGNNTTHHLGFNAEL